MLFFSAIPASKMHPCRRKNRYDPLPIPVSFRTAFQTVGDTCDTIFMNSSRLIPDCFTASSIDRIPLTASLYSVSSLPSCLPCSTYLLKISLTAVVPPSVIFNRFTASNSAGKFLFITCFFVKQPVRGSMFFSPAVRGQVMFKTLFLSVRQGE